MARRIAPLDAETKFAEDLTLTASDIVQMDAADRILKIGHGRQDFSLVVDVSALDIVSNDEKYTFLLQGSNAANMAAPLENLAIIELGATEVRAGGARDSVVGRYMVGVSNDVIGDWDYVHLNVIIAGTTPTITFSAWITKTGLGV